MRKLGRVATIILAIGLALVTVGCVTVRSAVAPGANLGALHTFAFLAPVDPRTGAARAVESPASQQIRGQLEQNLMARGYVPAPAGVRPDFFVSYRTVLRERTDVTGWGWGWGWGWGPWGWGGWGPDVYQYTEGTIVVDFVDPATHRALWRGTATAIVDHPENPNLEKVAKAVDKLTKDIPPATGLASESRTRM